MSTVQIVTSTVGIQGPPGIGTFVSISGTSYVLGEADRSKVFRFSNARWRDSDGAIGAFIFF